MSARPTLKPVVACFGEILWDCLPRGLFLGGAPLNVAYHLSRLGAAPLMVGAVGRDFLGEEVRRRLAAWGLDESCVARRPEPTGTVQARLDSTGVAQYVFATDPAWDFIPAAGALRSAPPPVAIVFGSLALRRPRNRQSLERLLAVWPQATRVVDINLRAPFDHPRVLSWVLARASILKLNTDELARLVGVDRTSPAGWARSARQLSQTHGIPRICVTAGARGAGLLWDGEWHWADARPVHVRDTVGAGDAFLAALLGGLLLRREAPATALARACRLGEFIASRDGATPPYHCDARGRPCDQAPPFPRAVTRLAHNLRSP